MRWSNVWLILQREVRDQLRDRRTLFMIAVLPLLLYPLLGMGMLQMAQFLKEHPTKILLWGAPALPSEKELQLLETAVVKEGEKETTKYLFSPSLTGNDANASALMQLEVSDKTPASDKEAEAEAKKLIDDGQFDAVVYIPPDFRDKLNAYRQSLTLRLPDGRPAFIAPPNGEKKTSGDQLEGPKIFFNDAKDRSKIAFGRLRGVLDAWREVIVRQSFTASNIPLAAARPFEFSREDVAEDHGRQAAIWSKILPFVVLIWALTGAFYPAIDLCAGEKERGTLETLLSSPAERGEIVWGKLLTVMVFSIATSLLNLASMGLTGTFLVSRLGNMGGIPPSMSLGPPPLYAVGWLILALIPISALFSALSIAVAAMARSTREGQYYLMPLLLISMPLMMLPMLPTMELELGTSLIPITGAMLLLKHLIEGNYLEALRYSVPVIAVTGVCVLFAIRWAIDQFNNEDVLFRESERFDLQSWIMSLVRDRGETPSLAEGLMCALILLMIRFFANFVIAPPTDWGSFATTTLVLQVAMIATPVLLMAIILTRSPAKTLLIRFPYWLTLPAAMLLAVAIHPLASWLGLRISEMYPLSPQMHEQLEKLTAMLNGAPNIFVVIALIAVTPAICEELAFRGFILSGLRHSGHKWGAIVVSAVFFGIFHLLLQQSILAAIVGVVIGYLAVKTESLLPAMLFHFVHNSLMVVAPVTLAPLVEKDPSLKQWFEITKHGIAYSWPVLTAAGLAALGLLLWFKSLPYHLTEEEKLQDALDHQTEHDAPAESIKTVAEASV